MTSSGNDNKCSQVLSKVPGTALLRHTIQKEKNGFFGPNKGACRFCRFNVAVLHNNIAHIIVLYDAFVNYD